VSDQHLSRSELAGWRDHGAGDRDRVVAHLAGCEACRHLAAELERDRPLDAGALPERFPPRDFVPMGLRAGGRKARVSAGPRRFAYLAAAASLALAVLVVPAWLRDRSDPVVRGDGAVVAPVRPVDATIATGTLTFEWTAAANAGALRLYVVALDDAGTPLIDRDVSGTRYEPTADERSRLQAGREYHWFVEYRGGGAGAGTSASARFRLR
jgi:hypothetical protein